MGNSAGKGEMCHRNYRRYSREIWPEMTLRCLLTMHELPAEQSELVWLLYLNETYSMFSGFLWSVKRSFSFPCLSLTWIISELRQVCRLAVTVSTSVQTDTVMESRYPKVGCCKCFFYWLGPHSTQNFHQDGWAWLEGSWSTACSSAPWWSSAVSASSGGCSSTQGTLTWNLRSWRTKGSASWGVWHPSSRLSDFLRKNEHPNGHPTPGGDSMALRDTGPASFFPRFILCSSKHPQRLRDLHDVGVEQLHHRIFPLLIYLSIIEK